jgi:hypothetical protein
MALLSGQPIPACGFREVLRAVPFSGRIPNAEFTLRSHTAELASAHEPFEVRASVLGCITARSQIAFG